MDRSIGEVLDAYDYEDLVIDGTAGGVALNAAKLSGGGGPPAKGVRLTFETAEARFRHDGGAPTAAVGHRTADGDVLSLYGQVNLRAFRAIRTTGVSANARVTYFR